MQTYQDLAGQVAVVTGGSRGIGAETCRLLAREGVKVVVAGRDEEALAGVVEAIRAEGQGALGVAADLTGEEGAEHLRAEAERAFGPVGLLAAFAGGGGDPMPGADLPLERWRAVLDANLTSKFLTLRAFLPGMAERGRGAAVVMSSAAGRLASEANVAYGAAEAGSLMLARHFAAEFGPQGVRVNALAPSSIVTDRLGRAPAQVREGMAAQYPLRRLGQPEDVARAALFLLSGQSGWMTGSTLDVAGGKIML